MKLRNALLPLAGTLALMALCTALPFFWFALRDRQLDGAVQTAAARPEFLSAAGRENPVARELYYWREQSDGVPTYDAGEPVDAATARQTVLSGLQALRGAGVLPGAMQTAAEELVAEAVEVTVSHPADGMTAYDFSAGEERFLRLWYRDGGALVQVNGKVGSGDGFDPAAAAAAYRTMLGLDDFTDWVDAAPRGYGDPVPLYSADAQLYLVANIDRGYFNLSVTSVSPEAYAEF